MKTTAREGHEETETSRGATYKTHKAGPFLTLPYVSLMKDAIQL